jgi:hypothetical protein
LQERIILRSVRSAVQVGYRFDLQGIMERIKKRARKFEGGEG